MLRLEVVEPGFRSRTYAAGQGTSTQFNLIAIMLRGNATLHVNEEAMEVVESSIAVLPHGVRARLSVPAGTGAWIIGFARPLQSLVTGTGPESLILDTILSRLTLTPGNPEILAASIAPLLPLLTDEVNDQNKRSQTAVASLVRLLLIAISRMLTSSGLADGRNDTHILHRFRQLVELGYRSRKTVTGYCQDLNLTYDRLNDICQRNLKRTPLSLIQQRILMDASSSRSQIISVSAIRQNSRISSSGLPACRHASTDRRCASRKTGRPVRCSRHFPTGHSELALKFRAGLLWAACIHNIVDGLHGPPHE